MDGRVLGEYGTSAADVKAEFIWLSPEVANDNAPFGGDDGVGGYAPLAVAVADGAGGTRLNWVHGNHLGVPQATTDATGAIQPNGGDYQLPGFPGQSRTFADLYYNRHRDYDPSAGRYIQADPIGLDGGDNPYLYAEGNPVTGIDPWGLQRGTRTQPTPQIRGSARGRFQEVPRWVYNPDYGPKSRIPGRTFIGNPGSPITAQTRGYLDNRCYPEMGVYQFPDLGSGGRIYTGQGNIADRLATHRRNGRLLPGTERTWDVPGNRTTREIFEHQRIQEITDGVRAGRSDAVSNQRDPIGPRRRSKLNIPEPE
jgi:RHS repeat-associated protein